MQRASKKLVLDIDAKFSVPWSLSEIGLRDRFAASAAGQKLDDVLARLLGLLKIDCVPSVFCDNQSRIPL